MCAGNELACTARSTSIVARATRTRVITPRGKGTVFRVVSYSWTPRFRDSVPVYFFRGQPKKTCTRFSSALSSDGDFRRGFRPRTTVSLQVASRERALRVLVSRSARRERFRFFFRSRNRRARTFLAMTTAMENLATGVGPVKRERTEIVPVNNQGTSLPRKKFFRARAHCNPLSDSTFPVCVPSRRPSEPPPPPSNARVLPRRTRGRGGRALPLHLRTRAREASLDFL